MTAVVSLILDIASALLLLFGAALAVISAIGLHRFTDAFSRLHASSVLETGAMLTITAGLLLQSPNWMVAVKLIVMALLLLITNPVSSHALAQAALYGGYVPPLHRRSGSESGSDTKPSHDAAAAAERGSSA